MHPFFDVNNTQMQSPFKEDPEECRGVLKKRLGGTGLEVSIIGFGGIKLPQIDRDIAYNVLNRALDLGINFIDTARGYGDSEEKIGWAIGDRRKTRRVLHLDQEPSPHCERDEECHPGKPEKTRDRSHRHLRVPQLEISKRLREGYGTRWGDGSPRRSEGRRDRWAYRFQLPSLSRNDGTWNKVRDL